MAISRDCSTQLTLPGMERSSTSSSAAPLPVFLARRRPRRARRPQGQLMLRYLNLVGALRPRWVVWENVPGVLSSGEDGILVPSSGVWQTSGMGSRTAFSTRAISECPSVVVASSLSAILEATQSVPPAYSLSTKACAGILRRAEKRGKKLPPQLEAALRSVANR